MRSFLTHDDVTGVRERCHQRCAGNVTGQPHGASNSSRTRWSRITRGPCPSSKWQATASRIGPEHFERVGLGVNRRSDGPRDIAPSGASSTTKTISVTEALFGRKSGAVNRPPRAGEPASASAVRRDAVPNDHQQMAHRLASRPRKRMDGRHQPVGATGFEPATS